MFTFLKLIYNILEVILNMDNNYIGGKWNILGERYDGELIYSEKNGLILLSIYYDESGAFTWLDKPLKFDELTGTINQRIKCILVNCEVIKMHTQNLFRHHVVIRAKSIFFNTNFRKKKSIKFDRLDFRLVNIFQWTNMNGFEDSRDKFGYFLVLGYKFSDTFCVDIDDNTKLEIVHMLGPIDGDLNTENINLSQYALIKILKVNKSYYEEFFNDLEKIKKLITIATGQRVFISNINCYDNDKYDMICGYKKYYDYQMIDYRIKNEKDEITTMDVCYYLFRLSDLIEGNKIKQWFDTYEENEKIYELYLLSLNNEVPMEIRFCNLIQAVELFHRKKYKNYNASFKRHVREKFQNNISLCDEILDNSDQKNSSFITIRSRMIDIFTENMELLNNDVIRNNIVSFSEIMTNTRNYYTHYDASKKDLSLIKDNLSCGISILDYIICYFILKELKFGDDYINGKLQDKVRYILEDNKVERLLRNERL